MIFAQKSKKRGAGEIVINSIDKDGEMKGYDIEFAKKIRDVVSIPMTILGGRVT
jgi:cyclase